MLLTIDAMFQKLQSAPIISRETFEGQTNISDKSGGWGQFAKDQH